MCQGLLHRYLAPIRRRLPQQCEEPIALELLGTDSWLLWALGGQGSMRGASPQPSTWDAIQVEADVNRCSRGRELGRNGEARTAGRPLLGSDLSADRQAQDMGTQSA